MVILSGKKASLIITINTQHTIGIINIKNNEKIRLLFILFVALLRCSLPTLPKPSILFRICAVRIGLNAFVGFDNRNLNTRCNCETPVVEYIKVIYKNNHPCVKPIKLITQIAKLFKLPIDQKVYIPFSGSGSEVIGFDKAGYKEENIYGCEMSENFYTISLYRREYWKHHELSDKIKPVKKVEEKKPTEFSFGFSK